jgi:uncharacterized membrane protein YsdA (DUF1294 family)
MPDRILTCIECGQAFVWSEGAQRYYAEHRLSSPKRCRACRQRRKSGLSGVIRYGRLSWISRPALRFGLADLGVALLLAALMLRHVTALSPWLVWPLAMTPATFLLFAYDKVMARLGRIRVPEALLLGLVAIGGTLGGLAGVWLLRHKIAKTGFLLRLWVIIGLQVVVLVALWAGAPLIGWSR